MDDYNKLLAEANELTADISEEQAAKLNDDKTHKMSLRQSLIAELKELESRKAVDERKPFVWPKLWSKPLKKYATSSEYVVVMYMNQKGVIEAPKICPIEVGDCVMVNNIPYQVDGRAMWSTMIGKTFCRFLFIKEIDRRPVSNLDVDEMRKVGGVAIDSDAFLMKAALRVPKKPKVNKDIALWILVVIGIIILGGLGYYFFGGAATAGAGVNVLP